MSTRLRDELQTSLGATYTIERELGGGGMSRVFLALDTALERKVVVKVLPPESAGELSVERFRREMRITAKLNHPNIIPILATGDRDGILYYVMPYVTGDSLRDRLTRERQLSLDVAFGVARDVLEALGYAHRQDVVHRDIKPENILFADGQAVVADFGIARAITYASKGDTITATGLSVGTPSYMSPEQAAGEREVDGRADQYALGCVLFEMMAGTPPFAGATLQALLAQHINATPPDLTVIRPTIPRAVAEVVQRAMAKAPADRFASAADFARALAAANVTDTDKGTPTLSRRTRRTRIVGALAGTVLVIGAGVIAFVRRVPPVAGSATPIVAVLPFENLGQASDEYFAEGMADEITSRLASLKGLGVISRMSARAYKNTRKGLRQIGSELHASYILDGTVRWQRGGATGANRVRVTPRLVRVADDHELWSHPYDADLADVFSVQGAIAGKVATELRVALGGREQAHLSRRLTENVEAYEYYLRAKLFRTEDRSRQRIDSGIMLAKRAVALDTNFAAAHAVLGMLYISKMFSSEPGPELRAMASAEVQRALALDSTDADAHLAWGNLVWTRETGWQSEASLRAYRVALALRPSDASVHASLGSLLFHVGLLEEARHELDAALLLDPSNRFVLRRVPRVLWYQQRFDSALQRFGRGEGFVEEYALVLGYRGRIAEGLSMLDTTTSRNADAGDVPAARAVLLARLGKKSDAEVQIRDAIQRGSRASHFHHAAYDIACAYALLGDHRAAMHWLRVTSEDGMPAYLLFAGDPALASLRALPAYIDFMRAQRVQWARMKQVYTAPDSVILGGR